MAIRKKKGKNLNNITLTAKDQHRSKNIDQILDTMQYKISGTSSKDEIEALDKEFRKVMDSEINTITKSTSDDLNSFLTKLFVSDQKAQSGTYSIDKIFIGQNAQVEEFIRTSYQNRLSKQAKLHELSTQLIELREAILVTRDAIVSSDVVNGLMSRNISFKDMEDKKNSYIPIIEKLEETFDLQKKIKNFIIPKSLEYGTYYAYTIPYAELFTKFAKDKQQMQLGMFNSYYNMNESKTIYESVNVEERNSYFSSLYDELKLPIDQPNASTYNQKIKDSLKDIMSNISVCNNPVPLPFMEEGFESFGEFYQEYVTEAPRNKPKENMFMSIMNDDGGVKLTGDGKKSKKENFTDIKDCYFKLIDPMHLIPIKIINYTIGYYYIQETEIIPMSGILSTSVYTDKTDELRREQSIIHNISERIIKAFDKPFLKTNIKFKQLIVDALNFYNLNERKIKFQFIPKEYITEFPINEDENGNGTSVIEPAMFYAQLYMVLLLFKIMSILQNSNDSKVTYVKQSGIDKNVVNKVNEIARKKQERHITALDMFSHTSMINKVAQGGEMFIPVGKSGDRALETEVLQGQDIQTNSELMEMLKTSFILATGVPNAIMNFLNEADFAKSVELANTKFQGRVVSLQIDFNRTITKLYKQLMRFSTNLDDSIIESFTFSFSAPKYNNQPIKNELIQSFDQQMQFIINLFYGEQASQDQNMLDEILLVKQELATKRLPMLQLEEVQQIIENAKLKAQEKKLDPNKDNGDNDDDNNMGM